MTVALAFQQSPEKGFCCEVFPGALKEAQQNGKRTFFDAAEVIVFQFETVGDLRQESFTLHLENARPG